jgi:hypothetical protein
VSGPADIFDLCAEWLAALEDAVATTHGGAIDRAFVTNSLPAFDCCPQLTVHPGSLVYGETQPVSPPLQLGQRGTKQPAVNLINLTCVVVRCAANGTDANPIPDTADLEVVARDTTEDLWAIWNWTASKVRSGELFAAAHAGSRREVILDPAIPINVQGGCVGWQIPIRVELGGYAIAS